MSSSAPDMADQTGLVNGLPETQGNSLDAPSGTEFKAPFFVVIDSEQTVSDHPTLAEARLSGQAACDAEVFPCTFSIQDADGQHIEDIKRTDGSDLSGQMTKFESLLARGKGT